MLQFSVTEKENLEKLRSIFDSNSSNNRTLKPKQLLKFLAEVGLNNELFLQDITYFFPHVSTQSITFEQILKFLDFIISSKNDHQSNIDAFKCFDRNGLGQIPTADILASLKKKLAPREYQLYSQLITQSYGQVLNYMDFFKKTKKRK